MEIAFHSYCTSVQGRGKWLDSQPSHFNPGGAQDRKLGGNLFWFVRCGEKKIFSIPGIEPEFLGLVSVTSSLDRLR